MDAFYAAVETVQDPSLAGKPLAVGSLSMLCTANYEARKFGVRAAMPGFIAHKLCPDLIFVPTNFEKYTHYSDLTRKVFQKYDLNFIATSLDEAYLNITDVCNERGCSGEEVAAELRRAIFEETGLTCSVGVAPNRMLAKVCSDINKPNGQFILPNDKKAVTTFISSLPIQKVGGIGKVTEHVLRDVFGINTCEEMLQMGALICALFTPCFADFFLSVGLGLGSTDTPQYKLRKSISSERTFSATEDEALLFRKLAEIAESLVKDMENEKLYGRTLTLKLKTAGFEVRTRAASLQKYFCAKDEILNCASKLLKAELPLSLRLIGLRMSQFRGDSHGPLDPMQKTLKSFVISSEEVNDNTNDADSISIEKSDLMDQEPKIPLGGNSVFSNENDCIDVPYKSEVLTESHYMDGANPTTSANNYLQKNKRSTNLFEEKAMSLSSQKLIWVDDYICSVCGFELPPNFIEERQEHLDYHLAEMLQEKESIHNITYPTQSERLLQKIKNAADSRKKHKSSTIDAYFIKGVSCDLG